MIQIFFDGGCRPTNPGNKYGSFEILMDEKSIIQESRFELGHGTSNEAEYESLERALKALMDYLWNRGVPLGEHEIQMFTDSKGVVGRISRNNQKVKTEPQQRMEAFAERCRECIDFFKAGSIRYRKRKHNVARFGH
jgi:ribonuclease HI